MNQFTENTHPFRSDAVDILLRKTDRPLLLVCNGPSMANISYDRIPDNPVIVRLNFFFFWKKITISANI